ncbi:MAG: RDD family protein [Dehalococcoidia bacterium]
MNKKNQNKKEKITKSSHKLSDLKIAGLISRLYAFMIDLGLIFIIIYTFGPISGNKLFHEDAATQDILVLFGYFVIPTIIWGRTPGKWVAGIMVVMKDGKPPGPASIPREMVGKFVSYISFGIGIVWIIFDKENQGWHDKIAGTYVVKNDKKSKLPFFLNLFKSKKK